MKKLRIQEAKKEIEIPDVEEMKEKEIPVSNENAEMTEQENPVEDKSTL